MYVCVEVCVCGGVDLEALYRKVPAGRLLAGEPGSCLRASRVWVVHLRVVSGGGAFRRQHKGKGECGLWMNIDHHHHHHHHHCLTCGWFRIAVP